MKLVMTLLVRNEADILEANLDYHLAQGVDHVIVTDHGSADATPEILQRYAQTGRVSVIREEGEEHHQSVRVTRMARLALTHHCADWVFHNDADEFWWPLSGTLRDIFTAIPAEYGQIEVQRRNFLPRPEGPEPFYSRLVYRERVSLNAIGGPLEPKVAHRPHPDVVVAPGNHWITGGELRPAPASELLEVFHFPMRSYEQFERKVVQIGSGYEKLAYRSPDVGRDQLNLLQVHREGKLRDYYESLRLEDDVIEQDLRVGGLVLDRRLDSFMHSREPLAALSEQPGGLPTRSFVAKALRNGLDLEAAQRGRAHAQAELEQAKSAAAQVQRELALSRTARGSAANLARAIGAHRLLTYTRRRPRWPRVIRRRS